MYIERPIPKRRSRAARPLLGAIVALAAMPALSAILAAMTWGEAEYLVADIQRAPSLALTTVTVGDVLVAVAGATAAAISAHLSLVALLLLATPRRGRLHRAVERVTPAAWRRIVGIVAAGALSAGLTVPAAAGTDASDAGWVPEPITASPDGGAPQDTATSAPLQDSADADAAASQGATAPLRSPHTVVAGDSLWSITADALDGTSGDGADSRDDAAIAAAWPALYEENRDVVGDDPGLIHPGQRLAIPEGWSR